MARCRFSSSFSTSSSLPLRLLLLLLGAILAAVLVLPLPSVANSIHGDGGGGSGGLIPTTAVALMQPQPQQQQRARGDAVAGASSHNGHHHRDDGNDNDAVDEVLRRAERQREASERTVLHVARARAEENALRRGRDAAQNARKQRSSPLPPPPPPSSAFVWRGRGDVRELAEALDQGTKERRKRNARLIADAEALFAAQRARTNWRARAALDSATAAAAATAALDDTSPALGPHHHRHRHRRHETSPPDERDGGDGDGDDARLAESHLMQRALFMLLYAEPYELDVRLYALRLLQHVCHGMEAALDLHAFGGLSTIADALDDRNATIRAVAAHALATASQNNPQVQAGAVAAHALPRLVEHAARDDEARDVRASCLFAILSLVENEQARRDVLMRTAAIMHAIAEALDESAVGGGGGGSGGGDAAAAPGASALSRRMQQREAAGAEEEAEWREAGAAPWRAVRRALTLARFLVEHDDAAGTWRTAMHVYHIGARADAVLAVAAKAADADVQLVAAQFLRALYARV